jgi:hypothetical protein
LLAFNFERDPFDPGLAVLFENDRMMILLVPAFEVDFPIAAVGFDQADDISPKLRVALQIKTTDFNIPKSPNTHSNALL